jgi:AraC-like DNA-binding protein
MPSSYRAPSRSDWKDRTFSTARLERGARALDNHRVVQALESRSVLSLSRLVEHVRSLAPTDKRTRRVDRLPDGRTSLVLRVLDDGRTDLTVVGPRTRALLKETSGFSRAVEVRFKPGWATPLLGVPSNELADRFVSLEAVWGPDGRELETELAAAQGMPEILRRIERAFASRARHVFEPASAPLARRAARLMEGEDIRVESLASRLGVTSRHLRRAFAENIGISPKDFARSARLQRALRLVDTTLGPDWVQIASSAGYYDQAHLIADFRDLIGLTPGAFMRRVRAAG